MIIITLIDNNTTINLKSVNFVRLKEKKEVNKTYLKN